jgi:hypothetical protein
MSKRVLAALSLALLAAAGWASAQPPAEAPNPPLVIQRAQDPDVVVAPPGLGGPPRGAAPGRRASASPGRYAVVRLDKGALLVDTVTGQTWDLERGADGRAAWVPARRLESEKDVRDWLKEREARRAAAQDRQRDLLEQAEKVRHDVRLQEEEARRALEQARRRLEELQRAKDKEAPK